MASLSIGAPRNRKNSFFVTRYSRIAVDASRCLHRRASVAGVSCEAAPNTFSGSGIQALARPRHSDSISRRAREAHPCRGSGQAKRRAHLPRRVLVRRRLGPQAASRRIVLRSRPGCPPVPAGTQSKPRGQEQWRRETCGVSAPREHRLAVSLVALVLGRPQFGVGLPGPGRLGLASGHG